MNLLNIIRGQLFALVEFLDVRPLFLKIRVLQVTIGDSLPSRSKHSNVWQFFSSTVSFERPKGLFLERPGNISDPRSNF